MKHFRWMSLFLLLLSANMTYAQDRGVSDSRIAEVSQTNCGVTISNDLIPGDGTLCEGDIAFGMLYELFPSIFAELLPVWELSRFGNVAGADDVPTLLGEYRGDQVFFVLFDLFYNLVLLCIGTYLIVLVLSVCGRLLKGEDLGDPNSGKDTPKSWILGGLAGGVFLVPFKNFFLGQLLIFSLAIAALSMANFAYSLFLSGNQSVFENVSNYSERELAINVKKDGVQYRHDFMADHFYRYLANVGMCKIRSSESILSGASPQTVELYDRARACTVGSAPLSSLPNMWDFDDRPPPFMWGKTSTSTSSNGGNYLYGTIDEFSFKSVSSSGEYCRIEDEFLPDYECGEINVNGPDWSRNPLVLLLDDPAVIGEHIQRINNAIGPNSSPSEIKSILLGQWTSMKSVLYSALLAAWDESNDDDSLIALDNEVVRKSAALEKSLVDNARPHFRQASQFLHQEAMNALTFGNAFHARSLRLSTSHYQGFSDFSSLIEQTVKSDKLTELMLKIQCNSYQSSHPGASQTADFLNAIIDNPGAASHAKCLDVENRTVRELNPDYATEDVEVIRQRAIARHDELSLALKVEWDALVSTLSDQRSAVESSFNETSRTDGGAEWWVNLRQKGYLSAADYAISASSVVTTQKRSLKQIVNNFSVSALRYDESQISLNLAGEYTNDRLFRPTSHGAGEALLLTNLLGDRVDTLISDSEWLVKQEMLIRGQPMIADTSGFFNKISSTFELPSTYLDRLGVSLSQNAKNEEACLLDPSGCPFPLSDPLIELTLFGHDMVDASFGFFAIALPAKALSEIDLSMLGSGKKNTGNLNKSAGLDKLLKYTSKILDIRRIIDLMFNVFSSIMTAVFLIGVMLAYLLPLIPKIYLYLQFISWLMVVVMSSFAVLLWSLFWIRFNEKRDILKSAGFHYGVELLFKPLFSLIAVLFAWYFFYVIAFSIGVGSELLWTMSHGATGAGNYLSILMTLIMITMLYAIGLHYAYDLVDNINAEIMKRLGLKDIRDKQELGDFLKAMLFDAAKDKLGSANDFMSQRGTAKKITDLKSRSNSAGQAITRYNSAFKKASEPGGGQSNG
jgi:hypothetical protein